MVKILLLSFLLSFSHVLLAQPVTANSVSWDVESPKIGTIIALADKSGIALTGHIKFKDGETYDGFVSANFPDGPGVIRDKKGNPVRSGFWNKGELMIEVPIDLPDYLLLPGAAAPQMQSTSLLVDSITYQGQQTLPNADGLIFFISADEQFWYYGSIKNAKASGAGFSYQRSTLEPYVKTATHQLYCGYFGDGKMVKGFTEKRTLEDYYLLKEAFGYTLLRQEYTKVNGLFEGCFYTRYMSAPITSTYSISSEHSFYENGKLVGWKRSETKWGEIFKTSFSTNLLWPLEKRDYNKLREIPPAAACIGTSAEIIAYVNGLEEEDRTEKYRALVDLRVKEQQIKKDSVRKANDSLKSANYAINCEKGKASVGSYVNIEGMNCYAVRVDCNAQLLYILVPVKGDRPAHAGTVGLSTYTLSQIRYKAGQYLVICNECKGKGSQLSGSDSVNKENYSGATKKSTGGYAQTNTRITTKRIHTQMKCSRCGGNGLSSQS